MLALAVVRILLADKPFLAKMYSWLTPDRYVGPQHPIRQAELKKLRAEAREISQESRKRIKLLGRQAIERMDSDRVELWFWELKDELTGKWRKTRYRMTEEEARTRHGDNARKIEGTLEVRKSDPPIPRG